MTVAPLLDDFERADGRSTRDTLRLETGPRQPEAVALYTSAGYRPIAAFGAYTGDPDARDSLFFERTLP